MANLKGAVKKIQNFLQTLERRYLQLVDIGDCGSVEKILSYYKLFSDNQTQVQRKLKQCWDFLDEIGVSLPHHRTKIDLPMIWKNFNVNCIDAIGRRALIIAIENEQNEMLSLLLKFDLILGDALLYAVQEGCVSAVELLLNYQEQVHEKIMGKQQIHTDDDEAAWNKSPSEIFEEQRVLLSFLYKDYDYNPYFTFTPGITPIILAAHRDHYELVKLLISRGDKINPPHDVQCPCVKCIKAQRSNSLQHSKSRIYAYKALTSPSFICLSSSDPIFTAFYLTQELGRLGNLENEFLAEYKELAVKCQNFAVALLNEVREESELICILNYNPPREKYYEILQALKRSIDDNQTDGIFINDIEDRPTDSSMLELPRLKLAIKYKQKLFVTHPHCQQLLASLWYEGIPGFRKAPFIWKSLMILSVSMLFPFMALAYTLIPNSAVGRFVQKPFIKFLVYFFSYVFFLFLLILTALRVTANTDEAGLEIRCGKPTIIDWIIVIYIASYVWAEIKQIWNEGIIEYIYDMWNVIDFITNSLYIATIALRAVCYTKINQYPELKETPRYKWQSTDPDLIAECIFAIANIFSTLRLIQLFTVNPHLGPIQISLGRMLNDIIKFFALCSLVLVAYTCGLFQLLWFYSKIRSERCSDDELNYNYPKGSGEFLLKDEYEDCVTRGRYLTNLFNIIQTIYWSIYGLIDLKNFNLEYPHKITEFTSKLMFGTFLAILPIVLLNLFIAMMNLSYQIIAAQADTEWKFARSKLWLSYFEKGGTLPPPFNIVPSLKSCIDFVNSLRKFWSYFIKTENVKILKRRESRDYRCKTANKSEESVQYSRMMEDLIKRYLLNRSKKNNQKEINEEDVNEIKSEINAFRFELLDAFRKSGHMVNSYNQNPNNSRIQNPKSKVKRKGLGSMNTILFKESLRTQQNAGSTSTSGQETSENEMKDLLTTSPSEQRPILKSALDRMQNISISEIASQISSPKVSTGCATPSNHTVSSNRFRDRILNHFSEFWSQENSD